MFCWLSFEFEEQFVFSVCFQIHFVSLCSVGHTWPELPAVVDGRASASMNARGASLALVLSRDICSILQW